MIQFIHKNFQYKYIPIFQADFLFSPNIPFSSFGHFEAWINNWEFCELVVYYRENINQWLTNWQVKILEVEDTL